MAAESERTAARRNLVPGIALTAAVALLACFLHTLPVPPFTVLRDGRAVHPLGADLLAVLLGLLVGNAILWPRGVSDGCRWIVQWLIPIAIVLLGATLDVGQLAGVGLPLLAIVAAGIAVASLAAGWIGPRCGLSRETSALIGAGTAICGSSAVLSVAPVVRARDDELAVSLATVNVLGFVAMFVAPLAGTLLGLPPVVFGAWCGAAIHAVPQVMAAAAAYHPEASAIAALVKLARVAMLAPLVLLLAARQRRGAAGDAPRPRLGLNVAPWFVWGFIAAAVINSVGLIPAATLVGSDPLGAGTTIPEWLKWTARLLMTIALAAIGLEVRLQQLVRVGGRALFTGAAATLLLALFSLLLIRRLIET